MQSQEAGGFNSDTNSRHLIKKGGLTADQYLTAISKKVDEVRDASISVEDEELALFALDGLDSSYEAFVTAVTATLGEISFSEFKGLLKAHEAQILRDSACPLPSANFTQISNQSKSPTTLATNTDYSSMTSNLQQMWSYHPSLLQQI